MPGMGIFDFLRSDKSATARRDGLPQRGRCSCPEHVEDLLTMPIPLTRAMAEEVGAETATVGDLVEWKALGVDPTDPDLQWLDAVDADGRVDGTRKDGPFHWTLWVGDEARAHYDDDAELPLDRSLLARPGVDRVAWEDRELLHVGVTGLCDSGVLAAAARALADPRVRIG